MASTGLTLEGVSAEKPTEAELVRKREGKARKTMQAPAKSIYVAKTRSPDNNNKSGQERGKLT